MGDRDTEKLIDAWLDGELAADEGAELRSRLERDPAVRQAYGPMVDLLRSSEPIEPPAGLRDRIVAAVHEQAAERDRVIRPDEVVWRRASNRLAWMGAMAASVALFLAGWFGGRLWMQPAAQAPVITVVERVETPVELSPAMLAAYAQSLAGRGSVYPVPYAVQGALIEMLAQGDVTETPLPATIGQGRPVSPPPRIREAPSLDKHDQQELPIFPLIQRL